MSNQYDTASGAELNLYQYAARTRRELHRALEVGSGMTGNVVRISEALNELRKALQLDEVMLDTAVRNYQREHSDD